jgi:predicted dehydrogenase
MRCAIVGTGLIARTHAETLLAAGHRIACVVNPKLERARSFAREFGADRAAAEIDEALGPDVDSVHVCTPPALHYKEAKAALEADKHLVCEKPLCLDPAYGRELAAMASSRGLVAAVDFNQRFHEACIRARSLIAEGALGEIFLVRGSYLQEFHALPAPASWRYDPELAGPMRATTEIGSHWIDLARCWTGLEIEAVSATFGNFTPERRVAEGIMSASSAPATGEGKTLSVTSEDAASISLRFSNGALGSLILSEVSHGRVNSLSLEVTGSEASLWWDSEEPYRLHRASKGSGVATETLAFGGGFSGSFASLFGAVYRDIERAARGEEPNGGMPPYPDLGDGAANAAVCAAIHESSGRRSAWVSVPSA